MHIPIHQLQWHIAGCPPPSGRRCKT